MDMEHNYQYSVAMAPSQSVVEGRGEVVLCQPTAPMSEVVGST